MWQKLNHISSSDPDKQSTHLMILTAYSTLVALCVHLLQTEKLPLPISSCSSYSVVMGTVLTEAEVPYRKRRRNIRPCSKGGKLDSEPTWDFLQI